MWDQLLKEADKNGDGTIGYEEFSQAMTDMYGSESGIGFGCAPKSAQYWWSKTKGCNTKTAAPCTHPPAEGCGTGVEKTHEGCCPACNAPPGPAPPAPPPTTHGSHHTSNVENAELYAVHPYRMATAARGDAAARGRGAHLLPRHQPRGGRAEPPQGSEMP